MIPPTIIDQHYTVQKSSFAKGTVPALVGWSKAFTDGSKLKDNSVGIGVHLEVPGFFFWSRFYRSYV